MAGGDERRHDWAGTPADGFHTTKKTYLDAERDAEKRQAYPTALVPFEEHQRVYLDEAGMDKTDDHGYGWCPQGERLAATLSGNRMERGSFMAAWPHHQLVAPLTYQGYCHRRVLETGVDEKRLPMLVAGSVIICDKASFHKGGRMETWIQKAGCHLLYLPPYSPDVNPMEHQWFVLKNRMRKQMQVGKPFRQVVDQAFIH